MVIDTSKGLINLALAQPNHDIYTCMNKIKNTIFLFIVKVVLLVTHVQSSIRLSIFSFKRDNLKNCLQGCLNEFVNLQEKNLVLKIPFWSTFRPFLLWRLLVYRKIH